MSSAPRLRIVAINDVYLLENLPRFKALVEREGDGDLVLVTLAGDFVAPSLLSSLDSGRAMVACMNACGVTHVVLGNHEDDIPTSELQKRLRELTAVCVGTNVHGFDPPLPPSCVFDVRGVRVGLVGVVMDDPASYRRPPFGGARVTPPNASALAEAERLRREERCSIVVAMTHQPLPDDRELAKSGAFPVIIAGHEHEVHLEEVAGAWIVKAGSDAVHAAIVDVDLVTARAAVRLVDTAAYPEDRALRARVDAFMQKVAELQSAALVRLAPGEVVSSIGTRLRQTSMGTLVCSRVRDALGADACLFNGGGIRGARDYAGRITYGDIEAEVPFANEIVVARLPGRVVREAVVASRAHAPAVESGGFLQIDDRLVLEDLVDDREYAVALVRELFAGLDHVEPLTRFAKEHPESVPPVGSGRDVKLVLVDAFAVALWHELGGFEAVDVNHDDIVTEQELAAATGSPITAGLVLRALDTDHDHAVSRAEAEAAKARMKGKPRSES